MVYFYYRMADRTWYRAMVGYRIQKMGRTALNGHAERSRSNFVFASGFFLFERSRVYLGYYRRLVGNYVDYMIFGIYAVVFSFGFGLIGVEIKMTFS